MATLPLETDLLERLLDPADPALQTRVLTDLLDRPDDDPEVVRARERVPEQPWMRATLAAHHGDGTWGRGFYAKYDGTSWVLLHLSEVGAPMGHPVVRAGVERLLATARPIASLKGALAFCRHRFVPGEGFGCFAVAESLLPACVMAVPKVLKATLAVPPAQRTTDDVRLIDDLVGS